MQLSRARFLSSDLMMVQGQEAVSEALKDADVTEKLNNQIPLDLAFRDENGRDAPTGRSARRSHQLRPRTVISPGPWPDRVRSIVAVLATGGESVLAQRRRSGAPRKGRAVRERPRGVRRRASPCGESYRQTPDDGYRGLSAVSVPYVLDVPSANTNSTM